MNMKGRRTNIYVYPAVFLPEKDGKYSIKFPDIPNCVTYGDNLVDGMLMAEDALSLMLYSDYVESKKPVPTSSSIEDIDLEKDEFVTYIICDITKYIRKFGTKAVKKTLSIPEWLNDAAINEHINFSQVLQDALKEKLQEN